MAGLAAGRPLFEFGRYVFADFCKFNDSNCVGSSSATRALSLNLTASSHQ